MYNYFDDDKKNNADIERLIFGFMKTKVVHRQKKFYSVKLYTQSSKYKQRNISSLNLCNTLKMTEKIMRARDKTKCFTTMNML